ncbi:MAG TPA: RimK/LysX family protein [Xanthomonadales bacterium]|nr:RimK/LysX family protein [Xanthomonadales bacterium]
MISRNILHLAVTIVLFCPLNMAMAANRNLEILGWVENAWLHDPEMKIKAKLDTGAETSSLDAEIVKKFRKDGKRWVRFTVTDRESNEEYLLVRERVRTIGVVQHDGSRQVRPVVSINMCIAGRSLETEVSLVDRGEFIYPLLLGRNALDSFALIDPANTFLGGSECEQKVFSSAGSN